MKTYRAVCVSGLLALAVAAGGLRRAAAVEEADLPSPFLPAQERGESMAATFRHPLHTIRKHWDKYFEIYPDELDGFEQADFAQVLAKPGFYLDRNIQFDLYFGMPGQFYRPFISPFTQDAYVNFSAWTYGTALWQKEARDNVSPLFYVDHRRKELVEKMSALPMLTPLHVWAVVKSQSGEIPFVEILGAKVIEETPLTIDSLNNLELAVRQFAKKRFELAAQAIECALKLELPDNALAKVYPLLGQCYFELRQYARARNAFVNAVQRDPENVSNLVALARADLRLGRNEEAGIAAQKAVTINPSSPEARAEQGLALAMNGDIPGGYKELDNAQNLAPHNLLPEANRNRAVIALKEGKLDVACNELSEAINHRSGDAELHLELGDVLLAMNDLAKAKLEFVFAQTLVKDRAEPYYKIAVVDKLQADALAKDNKADDAKKLYQEALDNVRQALQKDGALTQARDLEITLLRLLGMDDEANKLSAQTPAGGSCAPVIEDGAASATVEMPVK